MSEESLVKHADADIVVYEDEVPIRGCQLTLPQIKAVYRELQILTKKEGSRIVGSLVRPQDESEDDFTRRKQFLLDDAFRITVSIIGFDGQTAYSETEDIFESKNLPHPIRTIFFTNTSAFRRNTDGLDPHNRFSVWLHFDKPPLFDPNPLVSEPTRNHSIVSIRADDVGYFHAVQNIVRTKLRANKKWYSFIHEKFAYDIGVWFVALPCALYWVTVYSDYLFPPGSKQASFRIAFYIYGLGLSLLIYRALFGYIKWAFPVNILEENKDRATRHRLMAGAIVSGLIISGVKSVIGTVAGL
ncbi:hypothetical protein [Sinorhizobium meliloti]|uniref:hypothetical protein n=1 Tax=Rhizobium meliloti TaxID=382 RepID=UPI0037043F03